LSRVLSEHEPGIPDLAELASIGAVVFIPFGGGNPLSWTTRLESLHCPEFHLYDRELPPESTARLIAATRVNQRPGCCAFVTTNRALENYLHPQALTEASGGECLVTFGPEDCVATRAAQHCHQRRSHRAWRDVPRLERTKLIQKSKRWLNTVAVRHMSAALLEESDPQKDVRHWLRTIQTMLSGGRCGSSPF